MQPSYIEHGTVYRLQHKESKLGPYRHCIEHYGCESHESWAEDFHDRSNGHPLPFDTGLSKHLRYDYLRFGFTSMKQLNKWFSSIELELLLECGFEIVEVDGLNIWDDGYQCLFQVA